MLRRSRNSRYSIAVLAVPVLLASGGCAHRARADVQLVAGEIEIVELPEARVEHHADEVVVRSVADILDDANAALRAGELATAERLYREIIAEFRDESYVRTAHYNLALTRERALDLDEASALYRLVIETWPGSEDATWAYFRLLECLAQLGRHDEIPALVEALLPRSGLDHGDRVEAYVRDGNALLELRRFTEAERRFEGAIAMNERRRAAWRPGEPDPPLDQGHALIAAAHFGRGRIWHELFLEIRFVLPEERMTRDLADKNELFEQAQAAWLDCVRTAHPHWGPAAGYMVGRLHEDFYVDLLATEVPADFDELERSIYFEELRTFLDPALDKAMLIYENNLAMAYRLGAEGVWVDRTLEAIARLRTYREEQLGWDEEHAQVVAGTHPRSAAWTDAIVFRSEQAQD